MSIKGDHTVNYMELKDLGSIPSRRHCVQKMFSMSFKKYCKEKERKFTSRHRIKSSLAARASSVFLPSYRGTAFIAVFLTGCFLIECV